MSSGVVYRIVDTVTGEGYVGATLKTAVLRWQQHRDALRRGDHSNKRLQAAWNAHGSEAFRFTILDPAVDVQDLKAREASYAAIQGFATFNSDNRAGCGLPGRFWLESGGACEVQFMTIAEAVTHFGMSKSALHQWLRAGLIKKYKKPVDKRVYVKPSEIERLKNAEPKAEE